MPLTNPPAELKTVLLGLTVLVANHCHTRIAAIWPSNPAGGVLRPAIALNLPVDYQPSCEAALLTRCSGSEYQRGEAWAMADVGEGATEMRYVYALGLPDSTGHVLGILACYCAAPFDPTPELIQKGRMIAKSIGYCVGKHSTKESYHA